MHHRGLPPYLPGFSSLPALLLAASCATAPVDPITDPPPPPDSSLPCPPPSAEYNLGVWDLTVQPLHWDLLLDDINADVEVPAKLCIDGEAYPIALELQGSSTRKLDKKSFDVKLERGKLLERWPFLGTPPSAAGPVGRVLLKAMAKDQSLLREALSFDMLRALGYETPHGGFTNLRINGEYWGLYALVEPVNDDYLARHGYPGDGQLYKAVRKHGSRADFAPGRDLTRAFEAHPKDEYAELEALVALLQKLPLELDAFESQLDPLFPISEYFDRLIWVAYTQNGDAIAQNFFLYHAEERWYQLPWDSDISLGADWRSPDGFIGAEMGLLLDGGNFFSRRLLKVPELRAQYIARFRRVLDDAQLEAASFERLAYYSHLLAHDLALDQVRWERSLTPSDAFARIDEFLSERSDVLRAALEGF